MVRYIFIILLTNWFICFSVLNAEQRNLSDPTEPLNWREINMQQKIDKNGSNTTEVSDGLEPVLRISAIFKFGTDRKLAIINDKVVREGDLIFDEFEVVKIQSKQVTLKSKQNQENIVLKLFTEKIEPNVKTYKK